MDYFEQLRSSLRFLLLHSNSLVWLRVLQSWLAELHSFLPVASGSLRRDGRSDWLAQMF